MTNAKTDLPVIDRATRDATVYVTMTEAIALYGKTQPTTRKRMTEAKIEPVGVMPTGSVGRPAKLYDRRACEIAFGLLSEREASDAIMLDVAAMLEG